MSVFIRGEYVSVYKGGICQCLFLRGYLSVLWPHFNKFRPWRSKGDIFIYISISIYLSLSIYIWGYVSIYKGEYVSVYKGAGYVSIYF